MKLSVTTVDLSKLPFEEVARMHKILAKYNTFVERLEISELRQANLCVQFDLPIRNLPTKVPLTEKIKDHME